MVKFLNTTPLPLRIFGGVYKIFLDPHHKKLKIINGKVFEHYSIIYEHFGGGGVLSNIFRPYP